MNARILAGHRFTTSAIGALALLGAAAFAPAAQAVNVGVTGAVGTLGAGGSVTFGINDRLSARIGYHRFTLSENFEDAGIMYAGDLTLGGTFVLADWHPFRSGFRVSGGLIRNSNKLEGTADVGPGGILLGDNPVPYTAAQLGNLTADVGFDAAAPYVGIGWGNAGDGKRGFGFSFDLGVMFQGNPTVSLAASGGTLVVPPADLSAEEAQLESELNQLVNLTAYPVANVGISFSF